MATNYYVSKSATNGYEIGLDTNNGTSKSTPFLTVKKSVATVAAGDTVTINDGIYNETSYVTFNKGVTYNPETDYGVTIRGSSATSLTVQATLTTGTLTFGKIIFDGENLDTSVFYIDTSATIFSIVFNGTEFINGTQYLINGTRPTLMNLIATDIIGSGAVSKGGIILDALTNGSIIIDGFTGTITDLNTTNGALLKIKANGTSPSVTASVKEVTGTVTTLVSNIFGIKISNIPNALVENCTITMNGLFNADGITVNSDIAADSSNPIIRGNTVNHNGTGGHTIFVGLESTGPTNILNNRTNNALVYNNRVTGSNNSSSLHGIFVGGQSNAVLYGNRVTNLAYGYLTKEATNNLFSGNEAYQVSLNALRAKGSTNDVFVNNSVYISTGNETATPIYADDNGTTYSTGIVFKNNNIYSDVTMTQFVVNIPAGNDATFGGNNYYSTGSFGGWTYQGTVYNTFADWKSAKESTALSVDPSFIDIATSHELNTTSPLYLAGVFYSSTVKDFNGNYFYNPPTVGAYEFLFPVPISSLSQYKSDGSTSISSGGKTNEATIILKFTMESVKTTDTLTPQVEIQETGTAFGNSVTNTGTAVSFSGTAVTGSVTVTGLQNGKSYHWQARATNSSGNGNWTSFGSSGTDFSIDTTSPTFPSISSPAGYTRDNTRPTLIFKKSTDSDSGMSSYSVSLDSGKNRSFSTSVIPSLGNGTASYVWKDDNTVKITFTNENDSDSSNDEIQVYFKGLDSTELSEGKHIWTVTAYDSVSNSNSHSADYYIDKTSPSISELAIADVSVVNSNVSYNLNIANRMPSFSGLATDIYQGSTITNSDGTKDTFDKISSGPKTLTLTLWRLKDGENSSSQNAIYADYLSKDFSLPDIVNTANDKKFTRFYITTPFPLIDGYYKVQLSLKDEAGNTSDKPVFYLSLNFKQVSTLKTFLNAQNLETEIIKQETVPSETEEEKEQIRQEGHSVKIKILDTKNNPVNGVKVTIHSNVQEAITDEKGIAQFSNIESGDHQLTITYGNYKGEQKINLASDIKEFSFTIQIKETSSFSTKTEKIVMIVMGLLVAGLAVYAYKARKLKTILYNIKNAESSHLKI